MNDLTFVYDDTKLTLVTAEYADGSLAVRAVDASTGEVWATLSVRMPDDILPDGVFRLKDWSENAAIAEAALINGVVTRVAGIWPAYSGHVMAEAVVLGSEGICTGSESRGASFEGERVHCLTCDHWLTGYPGSFLVPVHVPAPRDVRPTARRVGAHL